jgi:hypothetical protein
MNKIKTKIIMLLFIALIVGISNFSYAGLQIKDGTTSNYTNVNISQSFDICYNLRDGSSTLGTCELDPHLTTSLDWGAVAYLAQSRYGANASTVSTNTTGNKTGVMNMNTYTQTATIFESRNTTSTNATNYRYRLEAALKDSNLKKYVDVISNTVDESTTKGRAIAETKNWYGANYSFNNASNTDGPIIIRDSLFGVYNLGNGNGQSASNVTFRPVIWN